MKFSNNLLVVEALLLHLIIRIEVYYLPCFFLCQVKGQALISDNSKVAAQTNPVKEEDL